VVTCSGGLARGSLPALWKFANGCWARPHGIAALRGAARFFKRRGTGEFGVREAEPAHGDD